MRWVVGGWVDERRRTGCLDDYTLVGAGGIGVPALVSDACVLAHGLLCLFVWVWVWWWVDGLWGKGRGDALGADWMEE